MRGECEEEEGSGDPRSVPLVAPVTYVVRHRAKKKTGIFFSPRQRRNTHAHTQRVILYRFRFTNTRPETGKRTNVRRTRGKYNAVGSRPERKPFETTTTTTINKYLCTIETPPEHVTRVGRSVERYHAPGRHAL